MLRIKSFFRLGPFSDKNIVSEIGLSSEYNKEEECLITYRTIRDELGYIIVDREIFTGRSSSDLNPYHYRDSYGYRLMSGSSRECTYINGKYDGQNISIHGTNGFMTTQTFREGKLLLSESYWSRKGPLERKERYRDGKQHGSSETYFFSGEIKTKQDWKDGKKHGLHESYYRPDQLQLKENWIEEKKHGPSETYYKNGQQRKKENWKDGKKHGFFESHFSNGQLQFRGTYRDGKKHGTFETYHKNGQLQSKLNFKNGELIK